MADREPDPPAHPRARVTHAPADTPEAAPATHSAADVDAREQSAAKSPGGGMGRERRFTDSAGVRWRVSERWVYVSRISPAIHCLVFDSGHALRHVQDFPFDWDALTAEELEALSWQL